MEALVGCKTLMWHFVLCLSAVASSLSDHRSSIKLVASYYFTGSLIFFKLFYRQAFYPSFSFFFKQIINLRTVGSLAG